jgi:hypothetical protein
MSDTSGTNQNAKRIKTARHIPTLDTLAAAVSTIHQSGLEDVEDLKGRLALAFQEPKEPDTARTMSPKLGESKGKRQKSEGQRDSKRKVAQQNYRRKLYVHQTYSSALSKDCHFFLIFLLHTAPRTCVEHKKAIVQLLVPEDTSRYDFTLSDAGYALLDSWAKDDQYDDNPKYLRFSRAIRHLDAAELEDFQTLERIFRERGVYGSPQSIEIINFLFPGCMFSPTSKTISFEASS